MENFYADCAHVKKPPIDYTVDKELDKDYPLLPLYESMIYEYTRKRYYSLKTNEYLRCRWQCYVDKSRNRVHQPFQFIDNRNDHVVNGQVMYRPWESIQNRNDNNYKMKAGPGVDIFGQIPIPDELLMKRGQKHKNLNNARPMPKNKKSLTKKV